MLSPTQDNGVFGAAGYAWFVLFLVYVLGTSIILARRAETPFIGG